MKALILTFLIVTLNGCAKDINNIPVQTYYNDRNASIKTSLNKDWDLIGGTEIKREYFFFKLRRNHIDWFKK